MLVLVIALACSVLQVLKGPKKRMDMATYVARMAVLLRAALAVSVEEYWRLEPPTATTVFIVPATEGEESLGIGDVWADNMTVDVYCETPWDDKAATGVALVAVVEAVKNFVETNRDLFAAGGALLAQRGSIDRVRYQYVRRPGAGKPCWAGIVAVTYRPSK